MNSASKNTSGSFNSTRALKSSMSFRDKSTKNKRPIFFYNEVLKSYFLRQRLTENLSPTIESSAQALYKTSDNNNHFIAFIDF